MNFPFFRVKDKKKNRGLAVLCVIIIIIILVYVIYRIIKRLHKLEKYHKKLNRHQSCDFSLSSTCSDSLSDGSSSSGSSNSKSLSCSDSSSSSSNSSSSKSSSSSSSPSKSSSKGSSSSCSDEEHHAEAINRSMFLAELGKRIGQGSGTIDNPDLIPFGGSGRLNGFNGERFLAEAENELGDDDYENDEYGNDVYMVRGNRREIHDENGHDHRHGRKKCKKCRKGGLRSKCRKNTDCACGLTCQGGKCVCPKPPPPSVTVQVGQGGDLIVTWPEVPGADYYDLYLMTSQGVVVAIQLFFEGNNFVFENLLPGSYFIFVFSGSNDCGMAAQYTQTDIVIIQPCRSSEECPPERPYCSNGRCVQCTSSNQCPQGYSCLANQCILDVLI